MVNIVPDFSPPPPICFCAGTHIATPTGEVPVEQLAVGDLVVTLDGREEPIRWIGTGQSLLAPGRRSGATPVIVRANALDYGIPRRDLRITKGHSLYLEGVLIPVENLINHRTILWDDAAHSVVIYHLELDAHEVLLADGAPTESYRDDGNRVQFQNVNPGWGAGAILEPFAPIVSNGPIVAEVWRRLQQRTGHTPMLLTEDPGLHLIFEDKRVAPSGVAGDRYTFEVMGAGGDLQIVTRSATPAELGVNHDQRRLGVALRLIVLSQRGLRLEIAASSPVLTEGFYPYEREGDWRWTDGAGVLPSSILSNFVAGQPIGLEIHVGCTAVYQAPNAAAESAIAA
jgi:hypothetical protein